MTYKKILLVLFILIISLNCGCLDTSNSSNNNIAIPEKSKIELKENWEVKLDSEGDCSTADNEYIYIVTAKQTLYIVNIESGAIENEIKLQVQEDRAYSVSVFDDTVTINYLNLLITVNRETGETINYYEASKMPFVLIGYDQKLYHNLLIFFNIEDDFIYAMDVNTGDIEWKIEGDHSRGTTLKLYQYQEMYFYVNGIDSVYYQIDPSTGNVINTYEMIQKFELESPEQFSYLWYPKNEIDDKKFKNWLINQNMGPFNLMDTDHIYSYADDQFYYFNLDGSFLWKIGLKDKIHFSNYFGRYVVLNCLNTLYLVDCDTKEVVWTNKSFESDEMWSDVFNNLLVVQKTDGSVETYDITNLYD